MSNDIWREKHALDMLLFLYRNGQVSSRKLTEVVTPYQTAAGVARRC